MQGTEIKKMLLSGSAWVFVGKVLLVGGGVLLNALLARLLSPAELGTYMLVFSLVQCMAVVGQLGLSQSVLRLVATSMGAGDTSNAKSAVVSAFGMALLASACVMLLLLLGGGEWVALKLFHSEPMVAVLIWAVLLIPGYLFQALIAEVFRGFYDIRYATIFGGLSNIVLTACAFGMIWVVLGDSSLEDVLMISVISGAISVLIAILLLAKKLFSLPPGMANPRVKELWKISWPLWVTAVMFFILSQADLWVMGVCRSDSEVALYGAASRLVLLMTLPLFVVSSVVPPMIAEMHADNRLHQLERIMRVTTTVAALPAGILLLVFLLWSGPTLGFIFGDYYRDASTVVMILCVGHFVNVLVGACGLALMMTGYQVTVMCITLVSGMVTILLALLVVQDYGAVGVAVAASSGMVLQNLASLVAVRIRLGIWTHIKVVNRRDLLGFRETVKSAGSSSETV